MAFEIIRPTLSGTRHFHSGRRLLHTISEDSVLSGKKIDTMEKMTVLLAFLAVTLRTALAVDCISCISVMTTNFQVMTSLQQMYGDNYDSRCSNNPTDITNVIPCSGSCMNINVTSSTILQGFSQPIVLQMFMRTCNPVTSLDDGCRDLSNNDVQNVQQFVGAGVALDNQIQGRYCVCNTDKCNQDISTLEGLPVGEPTRCHTCRYMEYTSSDPQIQQNFDNTMAQTPGLDIRCRDDPATVPYILCSGSCMSSEGTVNMTMNNNNLSMYLVQRQCASVRAETKCTMFNEEDKLVEQLLPVNSLKAAGVTNMEVSLGYCACSEEDCNGGHTGEHEEPEEPEEVRSASIRMTSISAIALATKSLFLLLIFY
ncbi:uncharacterized protein LOC106160468 [Lingula anatina]|uniref:Uncharacterized protein LOC106160468 n=1 Tax=Lingula anatina TaxID=7574 RepID=A0A1S3I2S4_LINAN|nr:uncharacterized protein LOC106160468 [Lingula anatina]|eukprot:XP_013392543.1 uncharacterized protein LOC106160468 [Lingula anatina]